MSQPDAAFAGELDDLATRQQEKLRRAWRAAILAWIASLTAAELEHFAATGDIDRFMQGLDLTSVRSALRDAIFAASDAIIAHSPVLSRTELDYLDPYAVQQITAFESRFLQERVDELRTSALAYIQTGHRLGLSNTAIANGLPEVLGIQPRFSVGSLTYRQGLLEGDRSALDSEMRDQRYDEIVHAALVAGATIDVGRVLRMVSSYIERAQEVDQERITANGAIGSANLADHLVWHQAMSDGLVDWDGMRRYWHVAAAENVCKRCRPIPGLNPDGRRMGEAFQTPYNGWVQGPQIHDNCRCVVLTRPMSA